MLEYTRLATRLISRDPFLHSRLRKPVRVPLPPDKSGTAKTSEGKELLSPGLTEFNQIDDDTINGVTYQVYTIDKTVARQRLHDVLGFTEQELGEVVNIEAHTVGRRDGYVHQTLVRMDVKSAFDPNSTDIIKYQTTYSDFGIPVQVEHSGGCGATARIDRTKNASGTSLFMNQYIRDFSEITSADVKSSAGKGRTSVS